MQKPHWARARVEERLLQRVSRPSAGETLDRRDLGAVGLDGEHQARVDACARRAMTVQAPHSPDEAALLGARQPEVVAQDVEQGVVRLPPGAPAGAPLTVDLDGDRSRHRAHLRGQPLDRRRDAAPAEHAQHRQPVVRSGTHRSRRRAGVGEQPLEDRLPLRRRRRRRVGEHARLVDHEHRPRPDAAVRDPCDPVLVDGARTGSPRPGRGPGGASGGGGRSRAGGVGQRQLDRRHELAPAEGRHARPDEQVVERDPALARRARQRRPSRRRRAAAGPCPPPARRCRCCPPASHGCGSGRSPRPPRPRRAR